MRFAFAGLGSLVAVAALAGGALTLGGRQSAADDRDPCCFTNPRYTGVCTVVPGEGESCASILAYLNNQASAGKSYCGNTTIRGGWMQVDCESKETSTDGAPEGVAAMCSPVE